VSAVPAPLFTVPLFFPFPFPDPFTFTILGFTMVEAAPAALLRHGAALKASQGPGHVGSLLRPH